MKDLLASKNIQIYWTENEEKSSVVERWNRTIKQWMWKYFTKHRTGVYIDILLQLIERYNTTYHRSIKCTPSDARKPSNHQQVFNALYGDGKDENKDEDSIESDDDVKFRKPPKFNIGDQVRITKKIRHMKKATERSNTTYITMKNNLQNRSFLIL